MDDLFLYYHDTHINVFYVNSVRRINTDVDKHCGSERVTDH